MRLDFSQLPLTNRAFSNKPMTFCEPESLNALSAIINLIAIETGNRKAREHWQSTQLRHLLRYAVARSAFWRQRIGTKKSTSDIELSSLPILSRSHVREQVKSEGCLIIPSDPIKAQNHSTSGSSGVPVEFFVSDMNVQYNATRPVAQYFIEGRDLTLNRTRLQSVKQSNKNGFTVKKTGSWLVSLESFIKT